MLHIPCAACSASFKTSGNLNRHISLSPRCFAYYDRLSTSEAITSTSSSLSLGTSVPILDYPTGSNSFDSVSHIDESQDEADLTAHPPKRRRVTVEEVEDVEAGPPWVHQPYPGRVAEQEGDSPTYFENMRRQQRAAQLPPHAPFFDQDEWELAHWLMRDTTQGGADRFCKLRIVSTCTFRLGRLSVYVCTHLQADADANQIIL